jgi:hypothetical protein
VNDEPLPRTHRQSPAERLERAVLVLILAVVAILAGKVAFGRVVDWTMTNSPDATPRNAGWTNGVISELLPIGVLLFIRHQKRHGRAPGTLAWIALVGACLFSLTAQLAQAELSVFGWIVAAMPSAAFMVLSKMVVSIRPTPQAATTEVVVDEEHARFVGFDEPSIFSELDLEEQPSPDADIEPEPADEPEPDAQSETSPAASSEPEPYRPHRVRPRSLTSRASVEKAARELGAEARPAEVAARAGVSESTARRYLPKNGKARLSQ